jgi:uncharacterized membrane protein YbhN (UPF0104 family)
MVDDPETPPTISWARALLTTAVILIVGVGVLVYGTNAVLTKVHNVKRTNLVGIATAMFFVFLFVFAWVLRQLQRRKML